MDTRSMKQSLSTKQMISTAIQGGRKAIGPVALDAGHVVQGSPCFAARVNDVLRASSWCPGAALRPHAHMKSQLFALKR